MKRNGKPIGKKIVVAIEGIDGSGKSTLIKEIDKLKHGKLLIYKRTEKSSFYKRLLSTSFVKEHHIIQIPLYLLLGWKNYYRLLHDERFKRARIILMDRCFLSNFCYYYPTAMKNVFLLKLCLFFEAPIIPQKIYILDEEACIASIREGKTKDLTWLEKTRFNYINSARIPLLKKINIEIVPNAMSINQKVDLIIKSIQKMEGSYDS